MNNHFMILPPLGVGPTAIAISNGSALSRLDEFLLLASNYLVQGD